MSSRRLFMSLALIALLVPTGTAWAGAAQVPRGLESGSLREERECSLMHVCQGGDNTGQPCTVNFNTQSFICEKSECPHGECVVEYVTDIIPGTLTIIADDQPVIQPGCVAETILLRVREDEQPHGLANTRLVRNIAAGSFTETLEQRLFISVNQGLKTNFLFRQGGDFTEGLPELFGLKVPPTSIPIIARVGKMIINDNHSNDQLGSVLSFRVGIGFAIPIIPSQEETPCPPQNDP